VPVKITKTVAYEEKQRAHIKIRKEAAKSGLNASSIARINLQENVNLHENGILT
jgi:hypothetical protein